MIRRKHFIAIIGLLILLCAAVMTVQAEEQKVIDNAGLFSDSEISKLEKKTDKLIQDIDMDVVILTIDSAEDKTAEAYADDYFDNNGYGIGDDFTGYLFLLDMDNREICISTSGAAVYYLTDERIESILDTVYDNVVDGKYYKAAEGFLKASKKEVKKGVPDGQHTYDRDTGEVERYEAKKEPASPSAIIFGGLVMLGIWWLFSWGVGFIYRAFARIPYRKKLKAHKYAYREKSTMNITKKEDNFVNQDVTFVKVQTPPPSSGGSRPSSGGGRATTSGRSTTHRSSSGRSHGGGSRKF